MVANIERAWCNCRPARDKLNYTPLSHGSLIGVTHKHHGVMRLYKTFYSRQKSCCILLCQSERESDKTDIQPEAGKEGGRGQTFHPDITASFQCTKIFTFRQHIVTGDIEKKITTKTMSSYTYQMFISAIENNTKYSMCILKRIVHWYITLPTT